MADPRHLRRIKIIQNLFATSFHPVEENRPNEDDEVSALIGEHMGHIDELVQKHAPKYPLDRIAKIDLAILRLAIYELVISREEPPKVVIDEAVTLAKEFGGDRSYAFINAVLGAIYKDAVAPAEEASAPAEKPDTAGKEEQK